MLYHSIFKIQYRNTFIYTIQKQFWKPLKRKDDFSV